MMTLPNSLRTKRKSRSKLLIKRKKSKKVSNTSPIEMLCFYDVDIVQKERYNKYGELEYLVSWKGYSSKNDSWIKNSWSIKQECTNTTDLYMLATIACNTLNIIVP